MARAPRIPERRLSNPLSGAALAGGRLSISPLLPVSSVEGELAEAACQAHDLSFRKAGGGPFRSARPCPVP